MNLRLSLLLIFLSGMTSSWGEPTPKIEIVGPNNVDFGKYQAGERKVARYKIRNAGTGVLNIIQIRKTCGCSTVTCDKTALKPQEDATVELTILPNSISGLFSKNIFVESSDPVNRLQRLTVSGNSVPLIEITPRDNVYAGRIPIKGTWTQSFQLKSTEPNLKLGEVEVGSNYPVKVTTNQVGNGHEWRYNLDVSLLPTETSGDLRCNISLPVLFPTNQPPVRIGITGIIGPELSIVPSTVKLPTSDHPITRSFSLRVMGQRTRILDPASLTYPKQNGVSFKVDQDQDGRGLTVAVTFSPEFANRLEVEGTILLTFSVPGASSAQLACKAK